MTIRHVGLALVSAGLVLAGCRPSDTGHEEVDAVAFLRVVAAEDARPSGGPELDVLLGAARDERPELRRVGIRALGRVENPALAVHIEPLLDDPDEAVRAEAANALAQAHHRADGTPALAPLLRRVPLETSRLARGALARSLGRLTLDAEARREVGRALLALTDPGDGAWAEQDLLVPAAMALASFARGAGEEPLDPEIIERLGAIASYAPTGSAWDTRVPRARALALQALAAAGALSDADVARALDRDEPGPDDGGGDPAVEERRVAAAWLARPGASPAPALVARALADPSARVRLEGVRAAAAAGAPEGCLHLLDAAAEDPDVGVRLAALDALAAPCSARTDQLALLERTAAALSPSPTAPWHEPAHALASLAQLDAPGARALLPRFAKHPDAFVRTWGARAALHASDPGILRSLLSGPDANVRAAALDGLGSLEGRAAHATLISALGSDDAPQVVLAVLPHLEDTPDSAEALRAAEATLDRLGRTSRQTLRDPRVALVDLMGSLGGEGSAALLEPFLRDHDEAVARRAADVLRRWTGRPVEAAPGSVPPLPLPTASDLSAMGDNDVVLHMARGGEIRIRLLPLEAPTNAFRLYEMARSGTLDGLTFHRVVPNFVIQGGSPLANEYGGHGAFTRDEVGLVSNLRGTVGLSTRGRDTGDGQIYVNLVDNVRLDHDYTVLGVVVSGLEVVDGVLEGDVIARAEIRPRS